MINVIAKPIGPLCNLSCQYCYYIDKKEHLPKENSYIMSDEVLEEYIIKYFAAIPNEFPEVFFGWQGGEPTLLGIGFFEKVLHFQKKHNQLNKKITNCLQTNGTLINSDWALFLCQNQFLVGISVDGPKEIHDFYRKDLINRPTFVKVNNAIQCFNKYNVTYNTLVTINSHNAAFPNEIYDYLKLVGSKYWQFIPVIEWQDTYNVTPESLKPGQYSSFMLGIFENWVSKYDYNNIWIQLFDSIIGNCLGAPASLCLYNQSCGRCLAIEHNGDVYSCDHYVAKEYLLGNIKNNSFRDLMNSTTHQNFSNYKTNLPKSCSRCQYITNCYGGCPKHRSKQFEIPENYLCNDYKMFFDLTLPAFESMANCVRKNMPISPHGPTQSTTISNRRNDRCSCGSGKKLKACCTNR